MKIITIAFSIILIVFAADCSFAGHVPPGDARLVARNFYYEHINQQRPVNYESVVASLISTIRDENTPVYFVFEISLGGWVVVSATDVAVPVPAYSFHGTYDEAGQPENFRFWMKGYEDQLRYVINQGLQATSEIAEKWHHYLLDNPTELTIIREREVLPLLSSTWDQGKYYNEMCPADPAGPGGHCVTGCVATAMGQLLNYFRFPQTGLGSYSYEDPPYGTLTANFDSTTYRWDLMDPYVIHSNLSVAELLYHLGVSVDMVYGPNGSGMYNHKAAYSLRTYFKYMPETQYVFRDSTTMDWDSLLVTHLDKGIPMYYAGWSVPNDQGHAFICDGYQAGDYYHFNWGWSSSYDGYFYTDNLNPGGNNFNLAQELIINAIPDTNTYTYPVYCQGRTTYTSISGTIEDGSGPLSDYAANADCSWLIAPDDSVNSITLSFIRFMTSPEDVVTVYDGDTITAPVLGIFSGDQLPAEVTTNGSHMLVTFQSDGSGNAAGFLASFSCELPVYCSGNTVMTAQTDTLSDGSGHFNYHNNTQCIWTIMPAGASEVTLYFTEFETQDSTDIVRIYDLQTQELIAEYSGSYAPGLPDPVTSTSGKLFMTFITNYSVTAPGWTAYYQSNLANVPEQSSETDIYVFPNPSREWITVSLPGMLDQSKISLLDLTGREVYSGSVGPSSGRSQVLIDVCGLSRGIYLLNILDNHSVIFHGKIVLK
jgi:hypothetical protein